MKSRRAAVRLRGRTVMSMSRRNFSRFAATGAAATAATAVQAQPAAPTIRWRLTSSFPKSVDALWGASPTVARLIGEMTDGKFTIETFAAGEIVPGLQVLDAVASG